MINPYKVLGVHLKSTDAEIRAAYIALATKHHPDKKKGNADKFVVVNEAYQQIKTTRERQWFSTYRLSVLKPCTVCAEQGCTSKGFKVKVYTACTTCGGAGHIIKTKENEIDVIELQPTDGPRSKGRNNKRRP